MRGFLRTGAALAAIAGLSTGMAFSNPLHGASLGPIVIETGPRVHVQGPGGKRVPPRVKRAREVGEAKDPFFGIASRGRTGAKARAALIAAAYAKTNRRNRDFPAKVSKPFKSDARNAVFLRAINQGENHNEALKRARRVAA